MNFLIEDASATTLENSVRKLIKVVQDLARNWDRRQTKSKLQKATIRTFGHLHDDCNSVESIEKMIKLLESVISCLPQNQKTLYNAQKCYPGFLAWNKY